MGHDYIEYEGRFEQFHDMDIWVLRHFFIEEARSMGLLYQADKEAVQDLYQYFERWDWLGPGVWLGLNLSEFVSGQENRKALLVEVLNRASRRVETFGDAIPLEYLKRHAHTPMAYHTAPQPTDFPVEGISRIRNMLLAQR
jgi:hypothetical protein